MYRRITLLIALLSWALLSGVAQETTQKLSADEISGYKEQSRMMISYLEGTLNFLGDPQEVIAEKEIIINDSYKKIFRDAEVQIEDDLDENREVPLRKNVQAYLKDIVFFYKQVQFTYTVSSVEQIVSEHGDIVFKVTVNRELKGITVNNDTVENNLLRYVEINLDPLKKDLRIVSIYSTKPNEKEEMRYWWSNLPEAWRNFFGTRVLVFDTLPMNRVASFGDSTAVILKKQPVVETDSLLISNGDTLRFIKLPRLDSGSYEIVYSYDTVLKDYTDTVIANVGELDSYLKTFFNSETVDISNNHLIKTLSPLSRLSKLEKINASNVFIDDISPLRNLNKLQELLLAGTPVKTIEPLMFAFNLQTLDISKSEVKSLEGLSGLTQLEKLVIDRTFVTDLSPIVTLINLNYLSLAYTPVTNISIVGKLPALKTLVIEGTPVKSLKAISAMPSLEFINFDNTGINDLSPLASDSSLRTIQANNTGINSLSSLEDNNNLRLIYCDNSGIKKAEALSFMKRHPNSLVIFDSQRLVSWWNEIPESWKTILSDGMHLSNPPTKEELQKIVNQKELMLANNKIIKNLEPLKMLFKLEKLDISNTTIDDLSPLAGLDNLKYLNLDNTPDSTLISLNGLSNLTEIHFENTAVSNMEPLYNNKNLEYVYCDHSAVTTQQVLALKSVIPTALVVYQTDDLNFWWSNLSDAWQTELLAQIQIDGSPSREQLQQMVDLTEIFISKNRDINDLEPLSRFHLLKELSVSFTAVSDLSPLADCDSLTRLVLPNNPIEELEPLSGLTLLTELNLENTSIDDITPLAMLLHLEKLNLAGTRVKKLKPLAKLDRLQELVINNTRVNKLTDIANLPDLKKVICYNTSIKQKRVDSFKADHPDCEVIFY